MLSKFTAGKTKEQVEEMEKHYKSSSRYRAILVEVLEKEVESLRRELENDSFLEGDNLNERVVKQLAEIKCMKKFAVFLK